MLRPIVHVNVAMSADGKIDTVARAGAAISSPADRERVDRLRAETDAVMVGGNTLRSENPSLTVRSPELRAERLRRGEPENPAKVGIVTVADFDPAGRFMATGPARRFVFTTARTGPSQIERLRAAGAETYVDQGERVELVAAVESLYHAGIRSVLVEGGGTLIAELFRLGLVDELSIYVAPVIFGGAAAPTFADGAGFEQEERPCLSLRSIERFDSAGGILVHYAVMHKER